MIFTDILSWITGADGGAFLFVSWAISWALEGVSVWENLSPKVKSLAILIVSALLGSLAVALQQSPELVAAIEPYFQPVIYAVLAWLGTQTAHKFNADRRPKLLEIEGLVDEVSVE